MADDGDATLAEFIADERAALQRFADWWRAHTEASPDMFPERMGMGDWWEQLMSFVNTETHNG